ncbi:MAG: alginate export family protein [Verrucomicrobiales bacterium]|nr:alginate export family protein [Verrucomicrobiales bacterium]
MSTIPTHILSGLVSLVLVLPLLRGADSDGPFVTKAAAANRVSATPDYVQSLAEAAQMWEVPSWKRLDWLDFGVSHRDRYEVRDQDYRTVDLISEDVLYDQTLLYLGIRELIDPLRFGVEFQDARRFFSDRSESANEANHTEILQAFGELYFGDTIGGEPVSVRFGRMAFDSGDRRLVSRNRYRNAINAFDGARLRFGGDASDFELDTFALRPVTRSVSVLDESSDDAWLYGVHGYLRGRSPALLLEPYYFLSDQEAGTVRHLHTTGVHGYGQITGTGWDYDWNVAGQCGDSGGRVHRAWAAHVEAGYTWSGHSWKPRLGLWIDHASGDRDPTDDRSGRFDSLFGDSWAHYGYESYFVWQNQVEPALRLTIQPATKLRCEAFVRSAWLASERDIWVATRRGDPTGGSGRHVGEEIDLRATWKVSHHLEVEAGYSHFFPGDFVAGTGQSPDTSFGYVAAMWRF